MENQKAAGRHIILTYCTEAGTPPSVATPVVQSRLKLCCGQREPRLQQCSRSCMECEEREGPLEVAPTRKSPTGRKPLRSSEASQVGLGTSSISSRIKPYAIEPAGLHRELMQCIRSDSAAAFSEVAKRRAHHLMPFETRRKGKRLAI